MTRGHNTNNIAEAGIRIVKDLVFERVKAYNLVQMFGFITETMELYFKNRLLQIAHSRVSRPLVQKYGKQFKDAEKIIVHPTDQNHLFHTYETATVQEQSVTVPFIVNTLISACSCAKGYNGALCCHQVAVSSKMHKDSSTLFPLYHKETKKIFAIVALGKAHEENIGFYASIHEKHLQENDVDSTDNIPTCEFAIETDTGQKDVFEDIMDNEADKIREDEIKTDLHSIIDDITSRLDGDKNFQKGVQKFVRMYQHFLWRFCACANFE